MSSVLFWAGHQALNLPPSLPPPQCSHLLVTSLCLHCLLCKMERTVWTFNTSTGSICFTHSEHSMAVTHRLKHSRFASPLLISRFVPSGLLEVSDGPDSTHPEGPRYLPSLADLCTSGGCRSDAAGPQPLRRRTLRARVLLDTLLSLPSVSGS